LPSGYSKHHDRPKISGASALDAKEGCPMNAAPKTKKKVAAMRLSCPTAQFLPSQKQLFSVC